MMSIRVFRISGHGRQSALRCSHSIVGSAFDRRGTRRWPLLFQFKRLCTTRFSQYLELFIFIAPESVHWLPLPLTHWLTNSLKDSCLVDLFDLILAYDDANSKLVEVVTIADVDAEDHVGNCLLIWELAFGHKSSTFVGCWSRFRSWSLGKILKLEFFQHFVADVWA